MKTLIAALFLTALCLWPSEASAQSTITAASCSQADVNTAIGTAVNGDTVEIPAGSCTWSSNLSYSKGITLIGEDGCTLDGDGRPTSCATVITDNVGGSNSLINLTCVPGWDHRISSLQIKSGTGSGSAFNVRVVCTNTPHTAGASDTTIRIDHMYLDVPSSGDAQIELQAAVGVVDHNVILTLGGIPIRIWGHGWYETDDTAPPSPDFGDASWSRSITWGDSEWLFFEDNTIDTNTDRGCTDGYRGARFVFRFNDTVRCTPSWHGTDSSGRARATRAVEIYHNTFDFSSGGSRSWIAENRDGSSRVWNNTAINLPGTSYSVLLKNYRNAAPWLYSPWPGVDGTSDFDNNDAGNPFATGTVDSITATVLTDTSQSWTPNDWVGYVLRRTSGCPDPLTTVCYWPIASNTSTTITKGGASFGTFAAGDTYEINLVNEALDQPGRGGGGLLTGNPATAPMGFNDQIDFPIYEWNNLDDGVLLNIDSATLGNTIRFNEHAYDGATGIQTSATSPFNGTSGTGWGTVANRPTTCTTGVGYFATDEGEWWSANPGNDGRFYICTATDTWTLEETPYTYPHPLIGGAPPSPPSAMTPARVLVR